MKFCLSSRQDHSYLVKADEIKVDYRDRRILPDLYEKYPEAKFILNLWQCDIEEVDLNEIKEYNILSKGRLTACINGNQYHYCQDIQLPFYFGFPITGFAELRSVADLGVTYVVLGEPLFFKMDRVKQFDIPVRAVPNVAHYNYLPRPDGVCGTWIRPEDVELYEPYIVTLEFEDCDKAKEQALFRIYAEQKNWPGELKDIISNFKYEGTNRMLDSEFGKRRLICGQRCQETGTCQLCYRALRLANPQKIREYAEHFNLI